MERKGVAFVALIYQVVDVLVKSDQSFFGGARGYSCFKVEATFPVIGEEFSRFMSKSLYIRVS